MLVADTEVDETETLTDFLNVAHRSKFTYYC